MELRVELLENHATLPTRAHPGDAGLDLYALESFEVGPQRGHVARTGVAIALPEGHVGLVADRSSMAKRGVKTAGGVIDSGYRGELHIVLWNLGLEPARVEKGDRIAQLLILPMVAPPVVRVDSVKGDATSRGTRGFGSSGR